MRRCDKLELNILQARFFFFFSIGKGFIFFLQFDVVLANIKYLKQFIQQMPVRQIHCDQADMLLIVS